MFGKFPSEGTFVFSVEVSLSGSVVVDAPEAIQRIMLPAWSRDVATGTADASFTDSGEQVTYQFYRQPCANTIFPFASPSQGGAWVTLSGSGFRYLNLAPQCKFGASITVVGEVLSDKAMRCLSPQSFFPLPVTFSLNQVSFEPSNWLVTKEGISSNEPQSQAVLRYFYITDMQPALGNANGGTLVYFKLNPEMDSVFSLNALPVTEFTSYMKISAMFGASIARCSPPPIAGVPVDPSYPVNDGATITSLGRIFQSPYIVCRTPRSETVRTVQVSLQLYANSTFLESAREYFYHGDMQFTDFYPKMILEKGGSLVYVNGKNFPNRAELSCAFGEANSTTSFISTASFLSSNLIVCEAPTKGKLASLPFFITTTGQPSESTGCAPEGCKELVGGAYLRIDYVAFFAQALITQISPEAASVEGGTNFVVRGARIGMLPVGTYTCKFGDTVFKGTIPVDDPTSLSCLILPGLKVGLYPVEISLNGYDYTQSAGKFVVNMYPSVQIFGLIPSFVPLGVADQIITLVGNNFRAKDVLNRVGTRTGVQVLAGGDTIATDFIDSNTLRFVAPLKSSAVTVVVEVSMNAIDRTSSNLTLKYVPNSNALGCPENCLNRGLCDKFYIEDPSSPTLEKEAFRCRCKSPYFGFVCSEGGFALISFSPRVLFQTGGVVVKVDGFNVASSQTNVHMCKFGSQIVNGIINSTSGFIGVMHCTAPPLFLNGSVALTISIDGGITWHGHPILHQISYMMRPLAATVAPSIAPFNGGTLVTITSMLNTTFPTAPFTSDNCINEPFCNYQLTMRHSNMGCKVGGLMSDFAYFKSIFHFVCQVPAFSGVVEMFQTSIQSKLDVSLNGIEFLGASLDFVYAVPQSYDAILPSVASTQGGSLVSLVGSGFLSTAFLTCKFGVTQASNTRYVNPRQILLTVPFVAVPSTTDIQCTLNGQQWDLVGSFQYVNMWSVVSFFPALGPEMGNTIVTVTGSNFAPSSNIQCKFGSLLSKNPDTNVQNYTNGALVLSPSTMICISPSNFIDRVGLTMKPKSDCLGHFVQGRKRNLCIPLSFDCTWKNYDASTLYLSCKSTPFGEVVVFAPFVIDGSVVDDIPTTFQPESGQNLHPDVPLRSVVDLWVTIDGQYWSKIVAPPGQKPRTFSYTETINVTVIDPDVTLIGSSQSAAVVRGEGFYPQNPGFELAGFPAVRCKFFSDTLEYFSPPATFIDHFSISCPVPAVNNTLSSSQLALPMKIVVEINGQQFTNNTNLFYFAKLWKVHRTIPSLSPMTGGISVTVVGPYFRSSTRLNCKFGDFLASSVTYVNETVIVCRTPAMATASLVSLEVSLDGFYWSIDQVQFEIYAVKNALFFGSASYQQLGLGDTVMRTKPEVLEFLKRLDVSEIALGQQHSLAIASVPSQDEFGPMMRKGLLYAWGDNFVGQLGLGDYTPRATPVVIRGCLQTDINGKCVFDFYDLKIVSVACGAFHSLAVSDAGVLYSWGWNTKGQLGQGVVYTGGNSPTPLVVHALRNQGAFIRRVAGGFAHTVAEGYISSVDQSFIWTWGANDKGQLGLGDFVPRSLPTRVQTLLTLNNFPIVVQRLLAGLFHTVVLSTQGDVFTVGLHSSGQLGRCLSSINGATGTCVPLPARVGNSYQSYPTFDRVAYLSPLARGRFATSIAVGSLHTAAIEGGGGDLFVWGNNDKGQLGLGTYGSDENKLLPTPVTLLGTKAAVCGSNSFEFSGSCVSQELYSLQQTKAVSVGAGGYHTFVIRGTQRGYGYKGSPVFAKTLFAFGSNEQGQLGLGGQVSQINSIVAVPSVVQFSSSTLGVLFLGLYGGFQHSAVLQTCPPNPVTPCSRQGFCSPDSTCTCYKGFRGFECQYQCDGVLSGGPSNVCYKHGNSTASLLISDYYKIALETLSGPALFSRLKVVVMQLFGSNIFAKDYPGSFAGSGAFNSSTTPLPGDIMMRIPRASIFQVLRSITHPMFARLVERWTHPVMSPALSTTLFPALNNTYSFQVAIRVLEAFVSDAFRPDRVAGYYNTRPSQIKRVWDNTKIECGICDYVQIAFSAGISPAMVESVFKMFSDVDCSAGTCSGPAIERIASEFIISTDVVTQVLNSLMVYCPACRIKFFDSGCMFDGSCVCAQGWTGDECKQECAPNASNPCNGNGRCLDDGTCDCTDENGIDVGWRGSVCNIKCKGTVNGKPCNGHGVCQSSGLCQCHDGYRGDGCELSCPGLIPNPNPIYANDPTKMLVCNGRGDCSLSPGSLATCNCLSGYVGQDCGIACEGLIFQVTVSGISRIAIANCSGHGVCKSGPATPTSPEPPGSCACDRGWRLSNCSKECAGGAQNPCSGSNQGTCTASGSCICEPGWRGLSCNRECAGGFSKPCNNRGICTPFGNCTCFEGYLSFDCGFECEGGAGNPCNLHGLCLSDGSCECELAYRGRSCDKLCPGTSGRTDGYVCLGQGICNVQGECECSGVYAGEDCSQFQAWFIICVAIIAIATIVIVTWSIFRIMKYREKLARRKRRQIKQKPINVDEPAAATGKVVKRRAFQRREIRKYIESGPTELEIAAHKQKQLEARTVGNAIEESNDLTNATAAPAQLAPVTTRPVVRSALNGLDFNLDDSEAEMDSLVAPLPPSEPNMRPKVLPMGSKDIAPPAPKTPPESQFIRAAKGVSNSGNAVAAPERNSAIVARSTEVCQPRGRFSIVVLIHHFVVASVTIPFHGFR
jgi:alpha-tubulin suppressor-like RCC1 family protein